MTYEALDVAKYIINYCNKKNYPISNLRLQKLLYFVQASFIQEKNEVCFDDAMHCWAYGPVIPKIYRRYKVYGSTNIPKQSTLIFDDEKKEFDYVDFEFEGNEGDRKIIEEIVEETKDMSVFALVDITHNQTPWKKNYDSSKDKEIPIKDMFKYFRG